MRDVLFWRQWLSPADTKTTHRPAPVLSLSLCARCSSYSFTVILVAHHLFYILFLYLCLEEGNIYKDFIFIICGICYQFYTWSCIYTYALPLIYVHATSSRPRIYIIAPCQFAHRRAKYNPRVPYVGKWVRSRLMRHCYRHANWIELRAIIVLVKGGGRRYKVTKDWFMKSPRRRLIIVGLCESM